MEFKDLIYRKDNYVAVITLNVPEKLNAISEQMEAELLAVIDQVHADEDVRVLVITGAGRGFCSGADLGSRQPDELAFGMTQENVRNLADVPINIRKLKQPTIAAINGIAAGGGLSIACAADIRIAGESARFNAVWVKRAILPDLGCQYFLPRLVGPSMACKMLFTGDTIDAIEAERIGLVSAVIPDEQLMSAAMELARRISIGPPIVIQMTKKGIYDAEYMTVEATVDMEKRGNKLIVQTEDFKEGIRAFKEKRSPVFRGR